MQDILLIGAGGHCRSVIDVIEQEAKYKIVGIIDKKELIGKDISGYKIIGCDNDLQELHKQCSYALVTIGHVYSNNIRVRLFNRLKEIGYILPSIISPLAYISKNSSVDEGTVIMHHALVNSHVKIGYNCIINSKALIEHDSVIEDNVHISTSATINGGCIVKADTFFGSCSTTKESAIVSGFIKAGSVVK